MILLLHIVPFVVIKKNNTTFEDILNTFNITYYLSTLYQLNRRHFTAHMFDYTCIYIVYARDVGLKAMTGGKTKLVQ